jgi:DNA-directed RNA polymerase subunit L
MKKKYAIILLAILAYVGVAFTVYRFKHPELTETQLILKTCDALTWR